MSNERNTENLIRDGLRRLGYYDSDCLTRVEEQKSETDVIVGSRFRLLGKQATIERGNHND